MLSKSQISFVCSLHQKKYRKEYNLFIVEGSKSIIEFINSNYEIEHIYSQKEAITKFNNLSGKIKHTEITATELKKISALTTPHDALALVVIPATTNMLPESFKNKLTLVLDKVQDPGNLGTIIRTADWFGFKEIICSEETVEAYNPKTVQATMGSLSRIKIHYTDLPSLFELTNIPVYGAFLDGTSIYNTNWEAEGFVVLGNEGNGITKEVEKCVTHKITIPKFGGAESLNVAISAAIFCTELRRPNVK